MVDELHFCPDLFSSGSSCYETFDFSFDDEIHFKISALRKIGLACQ